MVLYRAAWERFVRLAIEPSYAGAPAAGPWTELGAYFAAPTTSPIGSLRHVAQRIRTIGTHGRRTSDQMAPIPASRRAEGSLDFPFAGDFGGALLLAAFGATAGGVETADPGDFLAAPKAFEVDGSTSFSLAVQPDGGAVLVFTVVNVNIAGTITVVGTSMDGEDISEIINIAITIAAKNYFTQKSFATVGVLGVTVAGPTNALAGTIDVSGIQKVVHTFSLADTQPSLRVEEYGDPGAGSGQSWLFGGLLVNSMGLTFDASVDDGLLVVSPSFVGQYPESAAQSTYQIPFRRAYPAWTATAQRDGAPYARLLQATINMNLGAILRRTAQGSESPQQPVFGARQIQGSMRILTEDAVEYDQFDGTTVVPFDLTFTTPYKIGNSPADVEVLQLVMSEMYLETYEVTEGEEAVEVNLGFYMKENATTNAIQAILTNGVPDGIYD